MINRLWKALAVLAVSLATTQLAFAQDKAQIERGHESLYRAEMFRLSLDRW